MRITEDFTAATKNGAGGGIHNVDRTDGGQKKETNHTKILAHPSLRSLTRSVSRSAQLSSPLLLHYLSAAVTVITAISTTFTAPVGVTTHPERPLPQGKRITTTGSHK
eukprot:GHVU01074274.1.p4 GENE.GHVU01074274.1~~GHVU01074274.1.p4  ORF type:complete len:108 (+),score=3.89 GHVU01074274.1:3108-3431(+)